MAKELHIKIDKQIGGLFIDEMGWLSAGYSAAELDYALSEMPEPKRLIIHASSPGGDIEQGFQIYNRLLDLKKAGTEIHVINEAKAYSIMTFIAMAASPGKLFARKASMWSVHKPMAVVFDMLNADELRKYATTLDSFESVIVGAYTGRTGMSEKQVTDYLRQDMIISSEDAKAQGWIDEIIEDADYTASTVESAKMVAWKPVAFLPKEKINTELPKTENNLDTEKMPEQNKDAGFAAKVKAFAMEILNMKPEGEEQNTDENQEENQNQEQEQNQEQQPDPKDAEIAELKAKLAAEIAEKETTLAALNTANDAMVHMKTTFVPQARQNTFNKVGQDKNESELSLKERLAAKKAGKN